MNNTHLITDKKKHEILDNLEEIEHTHDVRIIHAIESGSRAWGFPSSDSDYDVRFIYHHPEEWYITAFEKKDYIDVVISSDLDLAGWDIGKCLRLLYKGNAVLHEWLSSPIVYRSSESVSCLKILANSVFYPVSGFHHYLSLSKKKFAETLQSNNAKSFLYSLRALLCAKWIFENKETPPVLFEVLVKCYLKDSLQEELYGIMLKKASCSESLDVVISKELLHFLKANLEYLNEVSIAWEKPSSRESFDKALLKIIRG